MKKITTDPSVRLDIYSRPDRTFEKTLNFVNSDETAYDFTGHTLTFEVKKLGQTVMTLTEGAGITITGGEVYLLQDDASFTLNGNQYEYQFIVETTSKKTWLNGRLISSDQVKDSFSETETITISLEGESVTVSINTEETATSIKNKYDSAVPQVTTEEITTGTSEEDRRWSVAKIVEAVTSRSASESFVTAITDSKADKSTVDDVRADLYDGEIAETITDAYEPLSELLSEYLYTTSTFSGWGFPIGKPQNFDGIKVKIRARSEAVTSIRVGLFVHDESGANLIDLTFNTTIASNTEEELVFNLGQTISNSNLDPLYFVYLCNKPIDFFGTNSTEGNVVFEVADGYGQGAYKTGGSTSNFTLVDVSAGIQTNAWFESGVIGTTFANPEYTTISEKITALTLPSVDMFLPSTIYATEGVETNIYFDDIIFSNHSLSDLDIDVTCTKGKQYNKFWRYTPTSSDAGTTTITVTVSWNGTEIISKQSTLNTSSAAGASGASIKVLAIGDSTTAGGQYVSIINSDYVSLAQPDITFIGTQGSGANLHEGRGGWTFEDYATAGRTFHKFNVSGVTTAPAIGAVYSTNGTNYTVKEVNITSGSGYFSCQKSSGSEPLASGTLTNVSGVGDASITYSSFELISGNPFWNDTTAALDIGQYLTDTGFTLSANDLVVIHLGINDVFNSVSDTILSNIITYANNIVDAFRAEVPGINIGFCITIPPTISQDGFGENYSNGQTLRGYLDNYKQLVSALLTEFDTDAQRTINTYSIGFNHCIDREYNFQKTTENANARNTEQRTVYTNGVHPATSGYNQMGDALYSFIRNIV